jgi:DNA-binding NtrC family response regulator
MASNETTLRSLLTPEAATMRSEPTILLVEDELFPRLDLSDALRDAGFRVLEAVTGDEAERILQAHDDIDLVLTDVQMPGSLDGLALARHVMERRPAIKVIVMSGQRRARTDTPSVFALLNKPFPPATAIAQIQRALGDRR